MKIIFLCSVIGKLIKSPKQKSNDVLKVVFKIPDVVNNCSFPQENLFYYEKIDEMYEQVQMDDEELEKIISSKIEKSKVEEYYKYCQCKNLDNLSKMCRATLLLNIHGFKSKKLKLVSQSPSGITLFL